MISVFDSTIPVDPFSSGRLAPCEDLEECRPAVCLRRECRHPARDRDDRLIIQGHGCYERQVLGLRFGRSVLLVVRRFWCAACRGTMSVLPSWVHPWRWYAAPVMVEAVWRNAVLEEATTKIRSAFALWMPDTARTSWRTLARWRRDLLRSRSLFGWVGAGCVGAGLLTRLLRLLFLNPVGVADIALWAPDEVRASARAALAGTVHGAVQAM